MEFCKSKTDFWSLLHFSFFRFSSSQISRDLLFDEAWYTAAENFLLLQEMIERVVVVAQLVERSLLEPEIRGSNPVKFYLLPAEFKKLL